MAAEDRDGCRMGFLSPEGLTDETGAVTRLRPEDCIRIVHPYDLYQAGCWHEYQKLLFDRKQKQPFKQVFREAVC